MSNLLFIISGTILVYLAWGVGYQLFYALLGKLYRAPAAPTDAPTERVLVVIPGYKEDAVIVDTARQALQHDYPKELYEVIVIADSFQSDTLAALRALPVRVEEVTFEKSTKSKALNELLRRLPADAYDILAILDADNVMAPGFLRRIAAQHRMGHLAIQGQRAPKNLDTTMAVLDGASEAANEHILCKGHSRLGLSARLAGSGMAFDYTLFREVMPEVDALGGFDKELELRLTRRGIHLAYDEQAIVYDEKVRKGKDFSRQRSRWIAAQFHYARRFFPLALGAFLRRGQLDFLNKASQMLLPPRLLTPGVLGVGALLHLVVGWYGMAGLWGMVLAANVLAFLLALPGYVWQSPHRQALLGLPMAFLQAIGSLLKLGQARRNFINTPHGQKEG